MSISWKVIDKLFNDNPNLLIQHHLNTYNKFFESDIKQIFNENNPIKINKLFDDSLKEFRLQCKLYLGGKEGDKLYYGKPIIYDNDKIHYMYPNEARLRNMTYGLSIHYDVDVEFTIINEDEKIENKITLEKIFLGKFPIMMHSNLCVLNKLNRQVLYQMGECRNDKGGYFIIDGKEKAIVCQEKFADNMIYVKDKGDDLYSYSVEIRSVSEDTSKPTRTMAIKMMAHSPVYTNNNIVAILPNVRKPIPLFILMRALGILSDKRIIEFCLLDIEKNDEYLELFVPSVHDANKIFTQESALKYIATLTKGKTVPHALEILMDYLLPHIGVDNFINKAYFIGYMVLQLLKVSTGEIKGTDRDNFKFKRIETTGSLINDLFKEYYKMQKQSIYQKIDKEYYYHEGIYQANFISLIQNNYKEFFKERIVETGFKRGFKGNWGAEAHTKKLGVLQTLNRLSFNSFMLVNFLISLSS